MQLTNRHYSANRSGPTRLLALALLIATTAGTLAAPALNGRVLPRPLTSGDLGRYALSGLELSGGLTTVGVGTAVYLEADVNSAIPASDIQGVSWSLTSQPVGSTASLATDPLGSNVPVYGPSDRLVYQVAGRILLRPDVRGQYTVSANIVTGSSGSTNIAITITAGVYMGVQVCETCHSGGLLAPNKYQSWSTTLHSHIFSDSIDGLLGNHISQSCSQCHTTGYDLNTNAVDGGFDDIAKADGWTFPSVLTNGNWASMPSDLQSIANVTCEACHGPGSEHANLFGNTNAPTWPGLTITMDSGDCNQCHDAPTHHVKGTEWLSSMHAVTTRDPSGPGREGCVGCHTANGFIGRIEGATTTNTTYAPIGCQACHEPHGQTIPTNNPHMLRTLAAVTLMDGTTVTNAGEGALCMQCHHSRQNATNYVETASGSTYFGPHEGPQADMLMGANGVTYGQTIPSSAHRYAVTNLCVTCHMQATSVTDPTFLLAGGHTFSMSCSNGGTNYDMVAACQQCHGSIPSFDFPRQDYDGDGVIEGVQTEVQHLLDKLALLLPPVGQPKSDISINSSWTRQQLRAAYNYRFVQKDGSLGIHNVAYAVGLLKASIADLSGVSAPGGLPDAWVTEYFGSVTNPAGAPNFSAAGDGVPNWMKYALGLNPLVPGIATTNGVVWDNVSAIGDTNLVHIYTAAEVAFDTEVGKTYQIQSISSLSGGWQNVGAPIAGTGTTISYVTPTRPNVQQFYRVAHTP